MALIVNNLITRGMSGRYGKVLVFKQYSGKTVATAYPKPTKKPPTPLQIARRQKFTKAVAMTRLWLKNPNQKQLLEQLADHWDSLSAYHAGIKYFMLDMPQVLQKTNVTLEVNAHQSHQSLVNPQIPERQLVRPATRKSDLYASLVGYFY